MRYGQIRPFDIANGEGVRVSIFVTGCTHHCEGCFNKEYQDFHAGSLWSNKETAEVIEYLSKDEISGLTVLGGEPFQNALDLTKIIKEIKKKIDKPIWIYSGYTFEQLLGSNKKIELLKLIDVLVDGKFEQNKKDLKLRFRGSSNQRIIDVQASLKKGEVVLYELLDI